MVLIRVYQLLIAPVLPPACRFHPSCSHYSLGVLRRFGLIAGLWLTLRRLGKCQPFHAGGWDPVPEQFSFRPFRRSQGAN